jgi:hypothetical protein
MAINIRPFHKNDTVALIALWWVIIASVTSG